VFEFCYKKRKIIGKSKGLRKGFIIKFFELILIFINYAHKYFEFTTIRHFKQMPLPTDLQPRSPAGWPILPANRFRVNTNLPKA